MARLLGDRRLLLAGIVALAIVVRLAGVGDSLSIDEGYSWLVGSATSGHAFRHALAAYENTPPLFYLLLTPLPLDHDEVWLRLPSLIAGVASVPVLYAAVRPLLGTPAALLAALGLAVAPYSVLFSNYSRGFALAGFGLLLCLWAAARLATGGRRHWWWLYALGALIAVYSEYDSALFLLPLVGALLVLGLPRRREVLAFGLGPFLLLLPWLGQYQESRRLAGVTKLDPTKPPLSAFTLRDEVTTLFFSDQGLTSPAGIRTLLYAVVVTGLMVAAVALRKRSRVAFWLFAMSGLGVLALHALVSALGPDVYAARYLTIILPLAATVLAAGVAALGWRPAVPLAAVLLVAGGAFVFFNRFDREVDPDYGRVAAILDHAHARATLTNSAVAVYYLRHPLPVLDRPFGIGRGAEAECRKACPRPFAIVDDNRIIAARRGPGRTRHVDAVSVRIVR